MMNDWLFTRAETTPQKIALMTGGQTFTYAELHRMVSALAKQWQDDIPAKSRVGILAENSLEYVCAIFALMRLDAVIVPLNTRLTADELHWQIEHVGCLWVLVTQQTESMLADFESKRVISLSDLTQNGLDNRPVRLDDALVIVHTSGTSGYPKGAVLTYGNVFYSAMSSAYRLGHLSDDVWLCTLPLFHVGGLSILIRACLYGITVDLRDKFTVEDINHALTHGGISIVSLVPTMLYRLLDAKTESWSKGLRLVLLGGAAADERLIQRCKAQHIPLATTYGLTEAASQVATALPDTALTKVGTVGRPVMFTQIRVVDEHGNNQPTGVYGEIIVKGLTVMQGYDHQPDTTENTLRDGWLYTGDMGYLDEDGDLFIVQRRNDLIVTGGENVYPAEVEAVLNSHPAVKESVVIGLPSLEWGQQVAAAVQLHPNHTITADELIAYSRGQLAGYKQPRKIRFVDHFPQTASGKIQRQALIPLLDEDA
jgi:O-succinylbenzoic acid--CoA ligase